MISGIDSFDTIIFDMDGTLVSSLSCIYHCVNQISEKYVHVSRTLEQIIANFGPPAYVIIQNLTSELPEALQQEAVSEYYKCYKNNVRDKVLVFPGIPQLLGKIRNFEAHSSLVTGVERKLMNYTMDGLDLSKYFEIQICSDDVRKTKPDPEGINMILEKTGSKPNETLFVGDSPVDMRAGKAAMVHTGAALWSPENLGDPRIENPDYEFHSIQQLSDFLFPESTTRQNEIYFSEKWRGK